MQNELFCPPAKWVENVQIWLATQQIVFLAAEWTKSISHVYILPAFDLSQFCAPTVTNTEYWSLDGTKSFQSDAGGWQHHSLTWGGSKNWQKSTKTGYVSDVALANHWATGQQDRRRTKTCSLCAAAKHDYASYTVWHLTGCLFTFTVLLYMDKSGGWPFIYSHNLFY